MLNHLKRFVKDESGAAAIEYGLLTSGISVAIIPAVKDVGVKLVAVFTLLQNAV
ncbi:MAG: Flp family type IVb pilin [Xanthobacteraceae bacterium]|jgi:Flp pilus assembly pilin Flp